MANIIVYDIINETDREQYDKLQCTMYNLNFHAAFKYLQSLMVRESLDACNSLWNLWFL